MPTTEPLHSLDNETAAAPDGPPTPTTPQPVGLADCQPMLDLLAHLCSAHPDPAGAYNWLLRWIAYPLQHQGAKMGRAVIMSGPQGCGKSVFWSAICQIYGHGAAEVQPWDIEAKFNAWALDRSLIVAEGIDALSHHAYQRLIAMIEAPTWTLHQQGRPVQRVQNRANFVFLKHSPAGWFLWWQRAARPFVCQAPALHDPALIERAHISMRAGGIPALRDYLLRLPLGDFGPHTPPPNAQSIGETP